MSWTGRKCSPFYVEDCEWEMMLVCCCFGKRPEESRLNLMSFTYY